MSQPTNNRKRSCSGTAVTRTPDNIPPPPPLVATVTNQVSLVQPITFGIFSSNQRSDAVQVKIVDDPCYVAPPTTSLFENFQSNPFQTNRVSGPTYVPPHNRGNSAASDKPIVINDLFSLAELESTFNETQRNPITIPDPPPPRQIQRFPKQQPQRNSHGVQNTNTAPQLAQNRENPSSESEDESSNKFLLNNAEELRVSQTCGDDHERSLFCHEILTSMFTQACQLQEEKSPKQKPKKKRRHQAVNSSLNREIPVKMRTNQIVETATENMFGSREVPCREIPSTKMTTGSSQSLNSFASHFSDYDEDFTPPRHQVTNIFTHDQLPEFPSSVGNPLNQQDNDKRNLQRR